jgi:hypothetical protein
MNSRRLPLIYLLLACLSLVVGVILGLIFDSTLFARMGSVVVLFGLMSEYALLKLELSALYLQLEMGAKNKKLSPSFWQQDKAYLSHIMVVVGTLVWGFGDLVL